MKLAHEARRDREARAKRDAELSKREAEIAAKEALWAERNRNPVKFLQGVYGDDWYDKTTRFKVDGVPTGDLIASEMDARLSEIDKRLKERDEYWEGKLSERDSQADAQEKQAYEAHALEYVKGSADKYPLIHAFGVTENITNFIESHFGSTAKRDESGRIVEPGELLTPEKAADMMEKLLADRVEAAQKAKAPQTPAAPKPPDKTFAVRRSLSTDVTASQGSTNAKPKPKTDDERLRALKQKWAQEEVQRHLDNQTH